MGRTANPDIRRSGLLIFEIVDRELIAMAKLIAATLLLLFLSIFGTLNAAELQRVDQNELAHMLSALRFVSEKVGNKTVRIFQNYQDGDCDASDYVKTCPRTWLLISISDYGNGSPRPAALYKSPEYFNVEFTEWDESSGRKTGYDSFFYIGESVIPNADGVSYRTIKKKFKITLTLGGGNFEEQAEQ
jgi:hypothetical protein